MKVTFYKKPNGAREVIDVTNVDHADESWFAEHNAKLSMEDIGGMHACYADVGVKDDEGEPDEAIELSRGRTCRETFHALRLQAEQLIAKAMP